MADAHRVDALGTTNEKLMVYYLFDLSESGDLCDDTE